MKILWDNSILRKFRKYFIIYYFKESRIYQTAQFLLMTCSVSSTNNKVRYDRRLYLLVMSRTRLRVNPHPIVAWMTRNSLLEAGAKSEGEVTATEGEVTASVAVTSYDRRTKIMLSRSHSFTQFSVQNYSLWNIKVKDNRRFRYKPLKKMTKNYILLHSPKEPQNKMPIYYL